MDISRVFISVGELSGDIVGARLIAEIRRREPGVCVFGTGGRRMREAGAAIDSDTNDIGVVGVTEVVRTLPSVAAAYRQIRRRISEVRPDVAVLIGNDVFNLILARWLKRRRIPTVSYFPPQVWLWRSLVGPIARSYDAIATSFPEEYETYARASTGTAVSFVGHYLASELRPATDADRAEARQRLGTAGSARVVGLLPGSRRDEISSLAPVLLDAAARLSDRDPDLRFVVATTETTDDRLGHIVAQHPMNARVRISRDSHAVMRSADLVLVASGTASLETALVGTPMIIVYKVSVITNLTARLAIRLGLVEKYVVGLPNLILGYSAVPEVLQERATAPIVAEEAWTLLANAHRLRAMRTALLPVGQLLRGSQPISDVADLVMELARRREPTVTHPTQWPAAPQRALGAVKRD